MSTITTDHKWKQFQSRYEVPESVLADEFDWTDEDDFDGFFCYRACWYHLSQFMLCGIPGWDGAHGESYFSGVLIKLSDDGEEYQVGAYRS